MGLTMHTYDSGYAPQRPARRHFMMYTARAQQAFQLQHFFFEQKDNLASMLNAVGHEAKAASFPACMDYPELIDAVTQLLQEAQLMSSLTFAQIQQAGVETAAFAEKVGIVEGVLAGIRMRAMAAPSKPAPRKRGRRDEEEDEEMAVASYNLSNKRNRYVAADHDMVIERSYLQTAWWTQPICD
ncbi:hypothetical protein B0A55_08794 [Friedmanniomyces simplex]|uniref:Uncharacterized protein n=1 Tax=Friedmanniomyces simplex TaxID=329884 RepID=A0A4U0X046_9PEZI|nr:hypothetical protein B0A55_08794 [Friedmanniomyces simplex]